MKNELLEFIKDRHVENDFKTLIDDSRFDYSAGYYQALKDVENWLESLHAPTPLDPYTCELCVGDVVEHVGSICKIKRISVHLKYPYQLSIGGWVSRSELVLIARSGATIKEVGNG